MERRNTVQKELVLSAVMEMHRHVTADEVYDFIKGDHPSVGKATVYRNLGILADENKVRRVEIPDGPDRFDFRLDNHYHVRCVKCGKVMDVDMDEVKDIGSHIRNTHGVAFIDYDILFKGICPDCQNKEKEEH